MGTFLYLAAVRSGDYKSILDKSLEWTRANGWRTTTAEPPEYEDWIIQYPSHEEWSYLEFKWNTLDWEDMTRSLSQYHGTPGFFFFIYDGDAWGYQYYDSGQLIGKFVSCPSMYPDTQDTPAEIIQREWNGAISEICLRMNIQHTENDIRRYIRHLEDKDISLGKAHPDDGHELEDPWVVADFMRRLGIMYPKGDPINTHYIVR